LHFLFLIRVNALLPRKHTYIGILDSYQERGHVYRLCRPFGQCQQDIGDPLIKALRVLETLLAMHLEKRPNSPGNPICLHFSKVLSILSLAE
jgi:hypothetical protein